MREQSKGQLRGRARLGQDLLLKYILCYSAVLGAKK